METEEKKVGILTCICIDQKMAVEISNSEGKVLFGMYKGPNEVLSVLSLLSMNWNALGIKYYLDDNQDDCIV